MKKKLLIVSGIQYGYLIDYYYHARNLADRFDITYLCMDEGVPRIEGAGCKVEYVARASRLNRRFDMRRALMRLLQRGERFDAAFTDFSYSAAMFFPLLSKLSGRFIFDIRTLDISPNRHIRALKNRLIAVTASRAPFVSVITRPIGDAIGLDPRRSAVIPLGAPEPLYHLGPKVFDSLRLLYIGTFLNRRIEDTVKGLSLFLAANPSWLGKVSYDIVGAGEGEAAIRGAIESEGLSELVKMHGFVPNDRALPFFGKNNVGVSFVPTCPAYDLQPPTKTYEYMAAGMAVAATSTRANSEMVDNAAGVLHADTPQGFAGALQTISERLPQFDSGVIRGKVAHHRWQAVSDRLASLLLE